MQKNRVISEVPQEDDLSSISQRSVIHENDSEPESDYRYKKKQQVKSEEDEDESFDMDEYQDIKSKGLKIVRQKENIPHAKNTQAPPAQLQVQKRPQTASLPRKTIKNKPEVLQDQKNRTMREPQIQNKSSIQTVLNNIEKPKENKIGISNVNYKPIYTTPYNQQLQQTKQYNYNSKSFNTLVKKSDRVSRFQQMNQVWNKTKFLNNNPAKEGRKLNLEDRIKTQKQQQKDEGIFFKYVSKSQLFI